MGQSRPSEGLAFAEMDPRLSSSLGAMMGPNPRTPAMPKSSRLREDQERAALALALVETGFRNSRLEELHAGVSPQTAVGDYSDVKVVTPYGEIAWSEVSRIDDEEMKGLMIEVVDRIYTMLAHPEPFLRLMGAARWDQPKLDPAMMDSVARWRARQAGMARQEVMATWPLDETKRPPPLRREHRAAAERDTPDTSDAPDRAAGPGSFETTPEAMRALAQATVADPAWIARAREALRLGADSWERAELEILDAVETLTHGQSD